MNTGLEDKKKSLARANRLTQDESEIEIKSSNFLTSLELINRANDDIVGEVINGKEGIDIQKLKEYIEIALVIENRNHNFNIPDELISHDSKYFDIASYIDYANVKRILYPMRNCKKEDFTSRGIHVSKRFESIIKNRICPDIRQDD